MRDPAMCGTPQDSHRIAALFKRLTQGGVLRRLASGDYAVVGLKGKRPRLAAAFIESLLARGLLRQDGEGLVLSRAAKDWLCAGASVAGPHRVLTAQGVTDEDGAERYVVVNAAESVLSLLTRRGLLAPQESEAGERLRRDYEIGQLSQRMGMDYSARARSRSYRPDMSDTALAARQRFNAAMKAAGPGLADILFDICCYLKGLEESERTRRWPRGSAKVVLRLGLARLAGHYGFGAPSRGPMRSWTEAGEDEGA